MSTISTMIAPQPSTSVATWAYGTLASAYGTAMRGSAMSANGALAYSPVVGGAEPRLAAKSGNGMERRGSCGIATVVFGDVHVHHLPSVPGRGEHMN